MGIPRLIHPMDVTIERIDKGATIYDPDTREPIQQASRTTAVTLDGQVRFRRLEELQMQRQGSANSARGYILFRKEDMDPLGFQVQINDKITQIEHQSVEFFVTELEWLGHRRKGQGGTLLKCWFDDRRPSKQSGV